MYNIKYSSISMYKYLEKVSERVIMTNSVERGYSRNGPTIAPEAYKFIS